MELEWLIVITIAAVVVIALAVFVVVKRRSQRLQQRFGPEYERAVAEHDSRFKADSELAGLEKRHNRLEIRSLTADEREEFRTAWMELQTSFVDDPSRATSAADALVREVMATRGYPIDTFDQQSADVSVDHPEVVRNYRAAHAISLANVQGHASTEDLRQGMVHYRALFADLLEDSAADREIRLDERDRSSAR